MNAKLKKLVEDNKRYVPIIIATAAVVITTIVLVNLKTKTLLEVTDNAVDIMRANKGAMLYETKYGDIMLMLIPEK